MAHKPTKIPIYSPTCLGKVGHFLLLCCTENATQKDEQLKVWHLAVGDKYIIALCTAANSPSAALEREPSHSHTQTASHHNMGCPRGGCSKVHELEMSPISFGKAGQIYSMVLNSFLHKTNFTLREIKSNDGLWNTVSPNGSNQITIFQEAIQEKNATRQTDSYTALEENRKLQLMCLSEQLIRNRKEDHHRFTLFKDILPYCTFNFSTNLQIVNLQLPKKYRRQLKMVAKKCFQLIFCKLWT